MRQSRTDNKVILVDNNFIESYDTDMKKRLNRKIRENQVIAFIGKYEKKNSYAPTYSEIADELELSMQQIFNITKGLEEKGQIIKTNDRNRKLVVNKK